MSELELSSPFAQRLLEAIGPTLEEGDGDDLVDMLCVVERAHAEEGGTVMHRSLSDAADDVANMDDAQLDEYYRRVVAPHMGLHATKAPEYEDEEEAAYSSLAAQLGMRNARSLRGNE